MAGNDVQNAWVQRVLGVAVRGTSPNAGARNRTPLDLLPMWAAAKDATDQSIEELRRALKSTKDPDLNQIAEFGLNGATTGQSAKLMIALRELGSAATPQNRTKVAEAVQAFREFLVGSPIVNLLEENPFGVTVRIRQTLGPALDQIERSLAA